MASISDDKFAKKYPDLENCNGVTQLPWREIVNKYLPEHKEKPKIPGFPDKKYGIIYADPPWQYDFAERTAYKLIKAFKEKDKFVEGMTYSELIGDIKTAESAVMTELELPIHSRIGQTKKKN